MKKMVYAGGGGAETRGERKGIRYQEESYGGAAVKETCRRTGGKCDVRRGRMPTQRCSSGTGR